MHFQKHDGTIQISLKRMVTGETILTVADDGEGFPDKSAGTVGFGLRLVHALASQLDGIVTESHTRGTVFTIAF